jgi:hypothetical protein
MEIREYEQVDILFLKGIAAVMSLLFIILISWLNRYDLLGYSIVGSYLLQRGRRRMGPRSLLIVIGAGFGLCYSLLGPIEDSLPLTYSVPWIHYWGYCHGISKPIHYNYKFYCSDGKRPLPAETQWYIQTLKDNHLLKAFLIILPTILPFIFAALVAYSISKFFKKEKIRKRR